MATYAYLVGVGVLGLFWLGLFLARKDLRQAMLWSGKYYAILLTIGFIGYRLLVHEPSRMITPGYWDPPSLFNLDHITGGWGIEDVLFMFFTAGIAAASYKLLFKQAIVAKPVKALKRHGALRFGLLIATILFLILPVNGMYLLIGFNLFGGLILMWQRRDLVKQALWGGLLFMIVYRLMFVVFNLLFPHFIPDFYHLQLTSHVMLWGVPIEEYLYGFAFGLLWAPLYEYKHAYKNESLPPKQTTPKSA